MKRVLVLGGYGGFGSGISERLAGSGFEVLVAGRSLERARRFCAGRTGLTPMALDRDRDLSAALATHRPFALVDAAGPFQDADDLVAQTCLRAGCHYIDIADGREFVTGLARLDAAAKVAGVSAISGASSVPALSGAVVRRLAQGLDEVREVEMAISASSKASAGRSVTLAILSYVGRPIRLWRGGRWETGRGWGELRRQAYEIGGRAVFRPRLVGLADVPDLDLLPVRLPGAPAVAFRAGAEFDWQNRALQLAGGLVRLGLMKDLRPLAPLAAALQALARAVGGEASGMVVRLWGHRGGAFVERRWTLVARQGCGPLIPCLAAPLLVERLARGDLPPGAGDAGGLLHLADFEAALADLPTAWEEQEAAVAPPLYAQVMGEDFARLAPCVRRMHEVCRDGSARGRAQILRGAGWPARLVGALFRFPAAGEDVPVQVSFVERHETETWTRDFAGARFSSRLSRRGNLLVERFGLLRFGFQLPVAAGGLSMRLRRWWIGPIPMPLILGPRALAREWEEDGRFWFDVPISLPLAGLVVHYRGWLTPEVGA